VLLNDYWNLISEAYGQKMKTGIHALGKNAVEYWQVTVRHIDPAMSFAEGNMCAPARQFAKTGDKF
jgi:hypothetical protein